MREPRAAAALLLAALLPAAEGPAAPDLKALEALAAEWFQAKDDGARADVEKRARAVPPIPADAVKPLSERIFALAKKHGPRLSTKGRAELWPEREGKGPDGKRKAGIYLVAGAKPKSGLLIAMHGGGENAGDADSAHGVFASAAGLGLTVVSPQAIRLVSSAWNEEDQEAFVLELVAAARRTLDVDPDRVYLAGHSMGGDGSWMIGGRNADRIAAAAPLAGSVMPFMKPGKVNKRATPVSDYEGLMEGVLPNLLHLHYWIHHSADDENEAIHPDDIATGHLKRLQERFPGKYDFTYDRVDGNGHALPKGGVKPILQWMVKHRREPHPAEVVWETWWGWNRQSYWLRCEGHASQWPWRWHAKVAGPNHVEVTGTTRPTPGRTAPQEMPLTILLSPRLFDLGKPLKVTSGGKVLFEGPVERSFAALLLTIAPRNDPAQWFEAMVDVKVPRLVWWDLWADDPNGKR